MLTDKSGVIQGIHELAEVIGSTMGGQGKNVALSKHLTSDGVTIINSLSFTYDNDGNVTPLRELGRYYALDASKKTLAKAGDGTSTTCVLLSEILRSHPVDAIMFIENLEYAMRKALEVLQNKTMEIKSVKQMVDIGCVAAKDHSLGTLIGEAVYQIGRHGNLVARDSVEDKVRIEKVEGYRIEGAGFMSRVFNPSNRPIDFNNPRILLVRDAIENFEDMQRIYEHYDKHVGFSKAPLLIISKMIAGPALHFMNLNIKKYHAFPIQVKDNLLFDDISFMAGDCKIFGNGNGDDATINVLWNKSKGESYGEVTKAMVQNDEFTLMFDRAQEDITKYVSDLKDEIRKSKLLNGIGIVHIGGITETEKVNAADRIDDAIRACFSSFDGYVYGSGATLDYIGTKLITLAKASAKKSFFGGKEIKPDDPNYAMFILGSALKKVRKVVFDNANMEETEEFKFYPVNVRSRSVDHSIVDSAKVLEQAIINSVSVAKQLIMTDYVHIPMMTQAEANRLMS